MLSQIARALRVDLAALTTLDGPLSVNVGLGYAHLPAVREAFNRWPDRWQVGGG